MPHSDPDRHAVIADTRMALMTCYARALKTGALSPREAFECLAAALGSLYREVAETHLRPDGCACGWMPDPRYDMAAICQALAEYAEPERPGAPLDLLTAIPAGRA